MEWNKYGLVFNLEVHKPDWLRSHAMTPTPIELMDVIRVYFTGRDNNGESKISFVDFSKEDPTKLLYVHDRPVMSIGRVGMFDDSGTICTCAVYDGTDILLYYTAYSVSYKVPYRNAIGLGISRDGGVTFERAFDGPVLDRSKAEPYFVISPWVIKAEGIWHMWYASATDWIIVNDKPESVYHIKYAWSENGRDWQRENTSCILPMKDAEANARPSVLVEDGKFKMWFTHRGSSDFRDGSDSYRLGYAEAPLSDPTNWTRLDDASEVKLGRDSYDETMQAYPAIMTMNGKKYLYYNGNGFGAYGFCLAKEH